MGKNTVRLIVAIVALLVSANAVAAQRYISDELKVNMRRGPSTSYSITELLEAGTQVETLSQSNGWTQIRTPGGDVGFVLTRLLSTQPAAQDRIDTIKAKLADLKQENKQLQAQMAKTSNKSEKLQSVKSDLAKENKKLRDKLEHLKRISSNAVQLSQQNQQYREKLMSLKTEMQRLRAENKALNSRSEGMKIGALILLGGIILGLILPMFRRRRKGNWDSL